MVSEMIKAVSALTIIVVDIVFLIMSFFGYIKSKKREKQIDEDLKQAMKEHNDDIREAMRKRDKDRRENR